MEASSRGYTTRVSEELPDPGTVFLKDRVLGDEAFGGDSNATMVLDRIHNRDKALKILQSS